MRKLLLAFLVLLGFVSFSYASPYWKVTASTDTGKATANLSGDLNIYTTVGSGSPEFRVVGGSIVVVNTIDGRDISADGAVLDSIFGGTSNNLKARNFISSGTIADVRAFGAIGDDATDNSTAIQAALNSGAAVVYISSGIYRISKTLRMPEEVCLKGDGKSRTILKATNAIEMIALPVGSILGGSTHCEISGIYFHGMSVAPKCIQVNENSFVRIHDNYFKNAAIGISISSNSYYCYITNNIFEGTETYGVYLSENASGNFIEDNTFLTDVAYGIYTPNTFYGDFLYVRGNTFDNSVMSISKAASPTTVGQTFVIDGNRFESPYPYQLYISTYASGVIANNFFNSGGAGTNGLICNGKEVMINNNRFLQTASTAVVLGTTSNLCVLGDNIYNGCFVNYADYGSGNSFSFSTILSTFTIAHGNVGIASPNPSALFVVGSGVSPYLKINSVDDRISFNSANPISITGGGGLNLNYSQISWITDIHFANTGTELKDSSGILNVDNGKFSVGNSTFIISNGNVGISSATPNGTFVVGSGTAPMIMANNNKVAFGISTNDSLWKYTNFLKQGESWGYTGENQYGTASGRFYVDNDGMSHFSCNNGLIMDNTVILNNSLSSPSGKHIGFGDTAAFAVGEKGTGTQRTFRINYKQSNADLDGNFGITMTTNGYVGIGKATGSYGLDVADTANFDMGLLTSSITVTGYTNLSSTTFTGNSILQTGRSIRDSSDRAMLREYADDYLGIGEDITFLRLGKISTGFVGIGKNPAGIYALDVGRTANFDRGIVSSTGAFTTSIDVGSTVNISTMGIVLSGDITVSTVIAKNISIPYTSSTSSGVIYMNGTPVIHTYAGISRWVPNAGYSPGLGIPSLNLFIGQDVGNFTMGADTDTFTSGSYNCIVGAESFRYNVDGRDNTGIGIRNLYANTFGYYNTAGGERSLEGNTSGHNNSGWGFQVLNGCTTGYANTVVGSQAGQGITTGKANTIIGAFVNVPAGNTSNNVLIGDGDGNVRISVDASGNIGPYYNQAGVSANYTEWVSTSAINLAALGNAYITLPGATAIVNVNISPTIMHNDSITAYHYNIFTSSINVFNDNTSVDLSFNWRILGLK